MDLSEEWQEMMGTHRKERYIIECYHLIPISNRESGEIEIIGIYPFSVELKDSLWSPSQFLIIVPAKDHILGIYEILDTQFQLFPF